MQVTTGAAAESVESLGNAVGPRYFSTMGTLLVEGREFTDQDRDGAPPVAMVNDVLARRLSPDKPVTGMTVHADGRAVTIVGVVRDAQYYVAGDAPRPQLFTSYWQRGGADTFNNDSRTFVRVSGDPAAMMPEIRRAVAAIDPAVPVSEAHPMRERVEYMFQPVRTARLLLTASAILAVFLCAVGLYGVLAFAVTERTREIGVRIAIGATRSSIARLVLRDAVTVIAIGVAVGLVVAWNSTQLVSSLLFGVSNRDAAAFVTAPLVIVIVAALASYLPARRATRVSPLQRAASRLTGHAVTADAAARRRIRRGDQWCDLASTTSRRRGNGERSGSRAIHHHRQRSVRSGRLALHDRRDHGDRRRSGRRSCPGRSLP